MSKMRLNTKQTVESYTEDRAWAVIFLVCIVLVLIFGT